MDNLERESLERVSNRYWLRQRLYSARHCLASTYRGFFKGAVIDWDNRRLVGNGFVLQWKVRRNPDEPISYDNQQTSAGIVSLERS